MHQMHEMHDTLPGSGLLTVPEPLILPSLSLLEALDLVITLTEPYVIGA